MTTEELEVKIASLSNEPSIYIYFHGGDYSSFNGSNLRVEDGWLVNIHGKIMQMSNITDVTKNAPINLNIGNTLGSDPELFFVRDNEVVPSNLVVTRGERVIQDGFQGELNPMSNTCRQVSGAGIGDAFREAMALAKSAGATVSLKVGHVIGDGAWKNSPLTLRRFGCNPTLNTYEKSFKRVTGLRERFRAAGGHIHMGGLTENDKANPDKLVALWDIFAGNTCVLIDRDPDNARRRKIYGRAGEHRMKSYGIEYRVLSNFWLKHYILWSFCTALLRNGLVFFRLGMYDEIVQRFDMTKVRKAINENDYELALENFRILRKFIEEKKPLGQGLSLTRIDKIEKWLTSADPLHFCKTLAETAQSWESIIDSNNTPGFEKFIDEGKIDLDEDLDDENWDDDENEDVFI